MEQEDALMAIVTGVLVFGMLVGFDYVVGIHIAWLLNAAVGAATGFLVYYLRLDDEPASE